MALVVGTFERVLGALQDLEPGAVVTVSHLYILSQEEATSFGTFILIVHVPTATGLFRILIRLYLHISILHSLELLTGPDYLLLKLVSFAGTNLLSHLLAIQSIHVDLPCRLLE